MQQGANPLKLTEEDGYRIVGADHNRPPPKPAESHPGFVELRELLGASKGRVQDWLLMEHIELAKERNWPGLRGAEFYGEEIAVCGGGFSLSQFENLRALRKLSKRGVKVFGVNRTPDWLRTKAIPVWGAALLDPIPHVAKYITPKKGTRYYIASQCHPETLDVFEGFDKYLWHARSSGAEAAVLTPDELDCAVASRTSTVGLRSIMLLYKLGFRKFHLFGFDSSYPVDTDEKGEMIPKMGADGRPMLHAYPKPETVHDVRKVKCVMPDGSDYGEYWTTSAMAAQADEFQGLIRDISVGIRLGAMETVFFYVHGEGLLPSIAKFYGLHVKKDKS